MCIRDSLDIGCGGRGPITEKIQATFFGLFTRETQDNFGWLEPIEAPAEGRDQVAHG